MNESTVPADGRSTATARGLSGIRVLEIGEMVSAPYATKLLADMGADVIKVEPSHGDRARTRGPFRDPDPNHRPRTIFDESEHERIAVPFDPDASGLYLALNTNKRNVVADANGPGRETVARLVAETDIIVTNLSPRRLAELGLDLEQARQDRPELVACSITAFGLTGPYASYRAEEITVANAGGWAYQTPGASSDVDLPPLKVFGHQTEFHAGMAAAMVTLAAFDRAERSGVGDLIDFSSMAHTAGMLEAALIAASYMDADPSRLGSRLLNPWKIFECGSEPQIFRDRPKTRFEDLVFLVTVEQDQWERLVAFMGNPEWATTGLFDTVELRLENEDLLVLYVEEWTRQHSVSELWHRGQENRICFAPVLTMAAMEHQEHLRERGFFVDVDHPVAGRITHLGPPVLTTPNLWGPLRPAPNLDAMAKPEFGPPRSSVDDGGSEAPIEERQPAPERPLEGIRILDFSWVWAGPYCTMHLAHLGAEVIKVEAASRPGLGRRLPLHPVRVAPSLNTSAYFNQWEQGKLSCQLDLAKPEAIELVRQLIPHCDVVVENFATGVMEKLGLGYD
ncbi:MAG: CoA transferase, partial [Acidimicrobiales bacterium]